MQKTIIYLGSDHAGFDLKEEIKSYLEESGHNVFDCGALEKIEGDDYPEIMARVARNVAEDAQKSPSVAIIFGGSGVGEAIVVNRFRHVRAVTYAGGPLDVIKKSREDNDTNVLSIGARFVTTNEAKQAIKIFLDTSFSHLERHADRVIQIDEITD